MKTSVVILTKNDNYGGNLNQRAKMCINSMVENFDEVVIVDWKTKNHESLLSNIITEVPHIGKIKSIQVSTELLKEKYPHFYRWNILEAVGRNVGIRRATGDWIASSNIDIVTTPLDLSLLKSGEFYTTARKDVEEGFHLGISEYQQLMTHLLENPNSHLQKPTIKCGNLEKGIQSTFVKQIIGE
jgi:hypothetical protein